MLVDYHIWSSLRAAMAETYGYDEAANRLRAQSKLRLLLMSEAELGELATMLSVLLSKHPSLVYEDIQKEIRLHRETAGDWVGALQSSAEILPEMLRD